MTIRFLISQQNYTVGAIEDNAQQMINVIQKQAFDVDVIIFSELSLTGYPPEDWLLRVEFQQRVEKSLKKIQEVVGDVYAIVGHPIFKNGQRFNAVSVLHQGKIIRQCYKHLLPNYGIFDEKRYFEAGSEPCVFDVKHQRIGILICEDLWWKGPWKQVVDAGAEIIVSPNASPFERHKQEQRETIIRERQAIEGAVPVIYVNTVGGQDELVFDGRSFVMNAEGKICWQAKAFEPDEFVWGGDNFQNKIPPAPPFVKEGVHGEALVYKALVLGTRDYAHKNGFKGALLGLSGGIDSALTLAIAVDALGPENVEAVMMPSRYTASMSLEDAKAEADALGISLREISIEPIFNTFLANLSSNLKSITQQNLQARARGMLLMALSNETGRLLLTTGNKSEVAVGYCTIYGDMAGGLAVLKDVLKTWVYRLAHYRNSLGNIIIPERVLSRAPSAELAQDQKDQDSLPPYEELDRILEQYIENNKSPEELIAAGEDAAIVQKIIRLIHFNEYKRRQSAPGIKVTPCAFGRDWRYPITFK